MQNFAGTPTVFGDLKLSASSKFPFVTHSLGACVHEIFVLVSRLKDKAF